MIANIKIKKLELLSFYFTYLSVVFLSFFWLSLTLRKNLKLRSLTLEKHFMKLSFAIKSKLYIKYFPKIFLYDFNTIINLLNYHFL